MLDLPTQRTVRSRLTKIGRGERYSLLQEINEWEKQGLLDTAQAQVLRRRYDFDFALPQATPVKPTAIALPPAPKPEPTVPESTLPSTPQKPAGPRPTLLQTLLSETSIKIALYLGAFFVIASAVILGALVEAARLPILIAGTLVFGVVALAIRKRIPQPSFALFIVFSFLLPITANVIEESLNLSPHFNAAYWTMVSAAMAAIWGYSTRIYESRLFSITSFLALTSSFLRLGGIFEAELEFSAVLGGLAALSGLFGVQLLKSWKDSKFAIPLFLSAHLLQPVILVASFVLYFTRLFDSNPITLWNLAPFITWGLAFFFYTWSDGLYPFIFFRWFTAAALIPMPWFAASTVKMDESVSMLLFFAWGTGLSIVSEVVYRSAERRKFNLPLLIASVPSFLIAVTTGFTKDLWSGFAMLSGLALVYGILHGLRQRPLLWSGSLLAGVGAYFTFFELPILEKVDLFFGYELLGLTLLLLLPDLFLRADFNLSKAWRVPPRIYAAFFVFWFFAVYGPSAEKPLINTAISFGIYALLFSAYALRYDRPFLGYLSTTALALSLLYLFNHFQWDLWLEGLTSLSVLYYLAGYVLKRRSGWSNMLTVSGLTLGSLVSIIAFSTLEDNAGWHMAAIGVLYLVEMYRRKQSLLEAGAHLLLPAALFMILHDFRVNELVYHLLGYSLIWLSLDLAFSQTFGGRRPLEWPVRILGGGVALVSSIGLIADGDIAQAALCFSVYTLFFVIYTLVQRKAVFGYIAAAYFSLTTPYILEHFNVDAWLPVLTGLAVAYFGIGLAIRSRRDWSFMFRNSGLGLSALVSLGALVTLKETGGLYALVGGLLFAAEMYLRRNSFLEVGLPGLFSIGTYLILRDFKITDISYQMLAFGLVWFGSDLITHLTFGQRRALKGPVRGIASILVIAHYLYLLWDGSINRQQTAAFCFGFYTSFFLIYSLLYRQPLLGYAFTVSLPLFTTYLFREIGFERWIFPVIGVAVIYYAVGYLLRRSKSGHGWEITLLYSGLAIGTLTSFAAPIQGGLEAAIPVALAATLWAVEAFARRNVWLGFPANALYLLAYFIILFELKVDEPQYFSMGAALLGMVQHYLLVRAGGRTGAFLTGMVSQLTLLGTTYIQMLNTSELIYFIVLFFQSLAVLVYGIVFRSRSLVFTPLGFAVLGVVTVIYSALKGISTVILIGCTGIILLMLGILAVVMRERITKLGERLSDWQA